VSRLSAARPEEDQPITAPYSAGLLPVSRESALIPRIGLRLPRQLSFKRWLSIGMQLSDFCSSSAWCLGDWLVYGEAAYSGRYRDAIEHTSLDYQTLRNYAWVAKRFPLSRRRDKLSFGHHTEVAALPVPEQDFWLRKAEELAWSCKQLRREVRASLKGRTDSESSVTHGDLSQGPPQSKIMVSVALSPGQWEGCQRAADRVGLTVDEWVVRALDQAVTDGLHDADVSGSGHGIPVGGE
jgi:hypothetical protein